LPYLVGVASVVIGLLLCAVAVLMVSESKGLLIGEGLDAETLKIVRKKVADDAAVERVRALYTLYLGPHEVLLTIELRFHSHISALEVRQAVRRLQKGIQSCHPDIKRIFFGAESLTEDGNLTLTHDGQTLDHEVSK
jgi:divalent metal cation (Fe/Co/Zn/Cd) transporter